VSTEIKQYWDQRAEQHPHSPAATTNDIHLRELEIKTLVETLRQLNLSAGAALLDVGCGDGYSTLRVAEQVSALTVLGIDYSESMVERALAHREAAPDLAGRVTFQVGDALELDRTCGDSLFDVVLTDRCLINLDSAASQARAFAGIARHTRPAGHYIAIENFVEGHEAMNEQRRAVGLPEIPIRWHNRYFTEPEFLKMAEPFYEEIRLVDFASAYYYATRVIYSAMCQMRGEEPDYNHEIHRLAPRLPWFGSFSPIRMAVMRRKSEAT
jgi:ubiquinone/menaquinone biosynthesis C-methylase UbiE